MDEWNKKVSARLLAWYKENGRALPFRQNPDAYAVWVSEIMAQQTRIEAMLPYYTAFLEKFPDLSSLAAADPEVLHKAWEGLGYYSRVRNMQKCARVLVEQGKTNLPLTRAELEVLPGIGPYTAGAIASIAGGQQTAAVDGNVLRIFSRLFRIEEPIDGSKVKKQIAELAEAMVPVAAGDFNQALMDLGSMVCIPKAPRCEICPLNEQCAAYAAGEAAVLPKRKAKKARRIEKKQFRIRVYKDGTDYALTLYRRPEEGLLAGLYGFEEGSLEGSLQLGTYVHVFSHVEWHIEVGLAFVPEKEDNFYTRRQVEEELALPSAYQPAWKMVKEYLDGRNRN